MYPDNDENTKIASLIIPVNYALISNYKTMLTINFNKLDSYFKLKKSTIQMLKDSFGFPSNHHRTSDKLKKKIERRILSGYYKTKTQLANDIGLSDSYVCRILKHKK